MPPRPASPCSRALRRQLGSPVDNIWVSDAMLSSVFERYFFVSHVARRRASSAPGPLESRRRLGKRRMGDLNAGYAPSALPEWALPNALDLSQWKWEPPTLLSVREEKRQAQLQLAQHWLGKWLVPPSIREEAQKVEEPTPPTPLDALDQFQSLVDAAAPFYDLAQACDDICLRFRNGTEPAANRDLLVESLGGIWGALDTRLGPSSDAIALFSQLYSAVLEGLLATAAGTRLLVDPELCQALLTQLLSLPAGDELSRLFDLTMSYIPAKRAHVVTTQVVDVLDKFFVFWRETAGNGPASHAQIQGVSNALSRLSPSKTSVFKDAERLLLEPSAPLEQLLHARYAWLSVLARLPRLGSVAVVEAFSTLFGAHARADTMSNKAICDLLLQHWTSTGRIRSPERVKLLFEDLSCSGKSTEIAALAHTLYTLDARWESRIMELLTTLKITGRMSGVSASFGELAQHRHVNPRLLRKVAVACDDYRVALRLHDLGSESCRPRPQTAWSQEIWSKYLEQAVCDPSTSISDVWRLLRLSKPNGKTAKVAANLAYETAHSDKLSNRATFRKVWECIAFLQKSGKGIPPRALVAAYRVVTRDLADGDWGRTSRLQWFLSLVRRECGDETAEQCRLMLREWRLLVGRAKDQEEQLAGNSVEEERRPSR